MTTQKNGRAITFVLLTFLAIGCTGAGNGSTLDKAADMERDRKEGEEYLGRTVLVGKASVSVPVGRFLLVRKGRDVCAIRFTGFHREDDRAFYAEYDWFYQPDGSGDFTKPTVKSDHQKLYQKATGLIHPFEWSTINSVRCGPFRLLWVYPTHVAFHRSNKKEDDVGNEIAPTKWRELSEINVLGAHLKWYRYDETRETIRIPIDQLW